MAHIAFVGNERWLLYYNSCATKSLTVIPVWDITIHHSENESDRSDIWCCHEQTLYVPYSFCLSCLQCRGVCDSSFAALISELLFKPLVVADFNREKDNYLSIQVICWDARSPLLLSEWKTKIKHLYFLLSFEKQAQCSWIIFKRLKKSKCV